MSGLNSVLPCRKLHIFVLFLCFSLLAQTILAKFHINMPLKNDDDDDDFEEHTVEEAYDYLGIVPNGDGTFTRKIQIPMVPPTPDVDPNSDSQIALSKDIVTLKSRKVRLYRPLHIQPHSKLPLIIYAHGGDFVLYSMSTMIFHEFCNNIAAKFPAIVASVEYRLAPENRLPAAYDDFLDVIFWAQYQAMSWSAPDPWMQDVDFNRVFLMGSSAGGNIVYHAALRAVDFILSPIRIAGILMNQPYFGGLQRTESEKRLREDDMIPLYVNDVLWSLALPQRANRDHEFANPISGGTYLGRVYRLPRVYIRGNSGDPLVDRGKQLANLLKKYGVPVVDDFLEGGFHGIELMNTTAAQNLYEAVRTFVISTPACPSRKSRALAKSN